MANVYPGPPPDGYYWYTPTDGSWIPYSVDGATLVYVAHGNVWFIGCEIEADWDDCEGSFESVRRRP